MFYLRKAFDIPAIIIISLALIVSPYLNFYSRYFIHESMFSSFSFLLITSYYRLFKSREISWAILTGIFGALVFTTKETSIIVFASFVLALLLTNSLNRLNIKIVITTVISFFIISVLFYSSFFTNPEGIIDSVTTFSNYFNKSASNTEHIQGWYYYLSLFAFNNFNGSYITEIAILISSLAGMIYSFRKKNEINLFFRWLSIFCLSYFLIFSLIPYKTPWSIMTGWTGLTILGGYGLCEIYKSMQQNSLKYGFLILLIILFANLSYQTYLTSYKFSDVPENPYTYSQPTKEIYKLTEKINGIIKYNKDTMIYTAVEDNQYWPLPWYLRKAELISWNSKPGKDIHQFDIIIADPKYIDKIIELLYTIPEPGKKELYIALLEEDVQIRPGKLLTCYIKNDFMQRYLNSRK